MWYLIATVVADVLGVILLGRAQGFARPWDLVGGVALMMVGFVAFSFATKSVPASLANAVWSGASVVLVLFLGRVFLSEHLSVAHYICVALIVAGTIGLSLLSRTTA
jgi:multidrug transporter EmrE-like cation transporter